jgi:hypothetical protein
MQDNSRHENRRTGMDYVEIHNNVTKIEDERYNPNTLCQVMMPVYMYIKKNI